MNPNLILPVGTQVVSRIEVAGQPVGALGEIVEAPLDPMHAYLVRFVVGGEAKLRRRDFSLKKQFQKGPLDPEGGIDQEELLPYVAYRCVVGSRAFGLAHEASDTDRRGFYLPPARVTWSLWDPPEQLENEATQECYWELRKFLVLALKANPNVLECLYTPLVELATPVAEELLAMREAFVSKLVYQTYNGYVLSQFKKLEQDLRATGELKWKHAMHLIRLLLSGVTVLEEGLVPVDVGAHRERLLAIRDGRVPWDEVNAWRLELHRRFDEAYRTTKLPERPDYARVNEFLIRARRSAL